MNRSISIILLACSIISCRPEEQVERMSGILILGDEVSDFRDCRDTSFVYWVVDETNSLNTAYQKLGPLPYEPVYLEVEALKKERLALGYAEERDGLLDIRKVVKIERWEEGRHCSVR